jgi:gamma-glutamyltranspeptidase/glutathione hydrolase
LPSSLFTGKLAGMHRKLIPLMLGIAMTIASSVNPQTPEEPHDRTQARSMVITRQGIVATSEVLASQAGAQILARGGSAADAAIAANAVLGVVEPMMDGMGGDLFAIEWDAKTGKLSGLNSSGWAPERLTPEFLKAKGIAHMPAAGIYSVTVPGCVRGWEALHKKFGRLPWAEIFRPAIYYAQNGFPVAEIIADEWRAYTNVLAADPNAASVFMTHGAAPRTGEVFRNPGYAHALELVASQGADAFYKGAIAAAFLKTSDRLGGVMTAADLADFRPEWVEPISTTYRGWTVYELPPNGQGMAALEMLNIFEQFPLAQYGFDSPEAFHIKMEAQKLAYADLRRYLADPRFAKVPSGGIISKAYGAERAKTIDMNKANCEVTAGEPGRFGTDTVYLNAVDRDGNLVSLIQSLSGAFGSGVVVEGSGLMLQNRGGGFLLDANSPDVLAPRKRPFHTIIPGFMQKGDLHIGFGIMGGLNQPQAHAQFVSNVVDYGMNIQAALEAPRFTKLEFGGCKFMIEDRVPEAVRKALADKGHPLEVRGAFSNRMGGGQVVMHDSATGVNYGASDPRKDGAAVPEPAPYFAK